MKKRIFSCFLAILMVFSLAVTAFADFENTYQNTDNYAEDIIGVASTQIHYSGTKYGNASGGAAFLSWCAREASVPREVIPAADNAIGLYEFFSAAMEIHSAADYLPHRGDIIFLGANNTVNQCGIVTEISKEYITAVLQNSDHTVNKMMYTIGLEKILYFATPDYSFVPNDSTGTYMTIATSLNFRRLPTTSSEIIATIPIGTLVNILEFSDDGNWGKIVYNGVTGWVSMDYVKPYADSHTDATEYAVHWNVIDVSKYQGTVDWNRVAESGIDGVILRIGFRATRTKVLYIDETFFTNYNGAKAAGLHIGCYFYSGAESAAEAAAETEFVINTINDNHLEFDMPVYLDIEDSITEKEGKTVITAIAKTFLDRMDQEKIYSGVYSNTYWLTNYYDPTIFAGHALWVADWRDHCYYTGPYGMWQYSDKGSVRGVESQYTDLNICYINYPKLIEDLHGNQQTPSESRYQKGDANGDGKITAADARIALRISAKLLIPDDDVKKAADVDGNGNVTASDARMILRVSSRIDKFN